MFYPYSIENGVVTVRDLHWSIPGDSVESVAEYLSDHAAEFIEETYRKQGKPIPMPSKPREDGQDAVLVVPIKMEARILLWNLLREKHMSTSEFARLFDISRQQAQFMVDGSRPVSIDAYCRAFEALGYYPSLELNRYK